MRSECSCTVGERLAKLERAVSRGRILSLILGVTLAILVLTGGRVGPGPVVEAERFVLKKAGVYYGEMGITEHGFPVVVLAPGDSTATARLPEESVGFYLCEGGAPTGSFHVGHRGGVTLQVGTPQKMSVVSDNKFMVYENSKWKWGAP